MFLVFRRVGYLKAIKNLNFSKYNPFQNELSLTVCPVYGNIIEKPKIDIHLIYRMEKDRFYLRAHMTSYIWMRLRISIGCLLTSWYSYFVHINLEMEDVAINITKLSAVCHEMSMISNGVIESEHDNWIWL